MDRFQVFILPGTKYIFKPKIIIEHIKKQVT